MNYSLNSRNNRAIEVCNKYMGDDENVIVDCINREMVKLENKPRIYLFDETLDKCLPDYYIKGFLMNYMNL